MANKTERLIDPRGWHLVQLTALHGRWARYTEGSWTRQHATDAWRCRQIRDMRRTDRMQCKTGWTRRAMPGFVASARASSNKNRCRGATVCTSPQPTSYISRIVGK